MSTAVSAVVMMLFLASPFFSQADSPKKVRGYKIYNAKILINSDQEKVPEKIDGDADSMVRIGKPQNFHVGLTGATFEVPMTMNIYKTSGRVESIAFEDVKVNGFKVNVADVVQPFDFDKGLDIALPAPLKITLEFLQDPRPLLKLRPPFNVVEVTGKVYVFGAFKKFGMKFKRVIPTEFALKTKIELPFAGAN
jgi:hypothetical protein